MAPSLDEPKTRFLSDKDKMVARAPILEGVMRTVTFKTDMMKVCGDDLCDHEKTRLMELCQVRPEDKRWKEILLGPIGPFLGTR